MPLCLEGFAQHPHCGPTECFSTDTLRYLLTYETSLSFLLKWRPLTNEVNLALRCSKIKIIINKAYFLLGFVGTKSFLDSSEE